MPGGFSVAPRVQAFVAPSKSFESDQARDLLTGYTAHLQSGKGVKPGVIYMGRSGAQDVLKRDRIFHLRSRSSEAVTSASAQLKAKFQQAYEGRVSPEKYQALMGHLDTYLASRNQKLGTQTFVNMVNAFEAAVDESRRSMVPAGQGLSEPVMSPSSETVHGVRIQGAGSRLGSLMASGERDGGASVGSYQERWPGMRPLADVQDADYDMGSVAEASDAEADVPADEQLSDSVLPAAAQPQYLDTIRSAWVEGRSVAIRLGGAAVDGDCGIHALNLALGGEPLSRADFADQLVAQATQTQDDAQVRQLHQIMTADLKSQGQSAFTLDAFKADPQSCAATWRAAFMGETCAAPVWLGMSHMAWAAAQNGRSVQVYMPDVMDPTRLVTTGGVLNPQMPGEPLRLLNTDTNMARGEKEINEKLKIAFQKYESDGEDVWGNQMPEPWPPTVQRLRELHHMTPLEREQQPDWLYMHEEIQDTFGGKIDDMLATYAQAGFLGGHWDAISLTE